jgi:predicted dehydrogenase
VIRPRWGVIGLGVGRQHALELQEMADADLVALCDRDRATLALAGSELSDIETYEDENDLLDSGKIDAVVIATYDNEHAAAIVRAIDNGLHVFAEKPLAISRAELTLIRSALDRHPQVRLSTNTLLRRSPRFKWLKSRISSGHLGDLFHVEGDYLYGRLAKLTDGWRGSDPDYSVTLGGAIHIVDLLMWLASERPVRVTAIGSGKGFRDSPLSEGSSFRGDDFRMALLEFDSGLTAKISANFACVFPHFHRVDVFGSRETFLHVPGTGGTGSDESSGLLFASRDPEETPTIVDLPYPAVPKGALLPEFNRVVLGSGLLDVPEQEVLDVMAVCLAIDESRRKGWPVDVVYEPVLSRRAWPDEAGEVRL